MQFRIESSALISFVAVCAICQAPLAAQDAQQFPEIFNTEKSELKPSTPQEATRALALPDGFRATLFAGEPDVQQPIALATDDRGRLWVAENYTYAEREINFDVRLRDRIVILEDADGDGRFDKRTVFWDQGQKLTSIEIGHGGVWALCAPHLLFIADRDGDDVPDGEPQIVLDGWDGDAVRHNIVNGLRWGPDGWLYGRHGIKATSRVGPPGDPAELRTPINCGIWRYHPAREKFEVVCEGTTNPWGMDWDRHGQLFFINTVIGHLWHALPGAHFERMYGSDLNPYVFDLIAQTADHYHWNTSEQWHDIKSIGMSDKTNRAGGGHAHCGMMIYLGDNWPQNYRGGVFTVNLHGMRVNHDRLVRRGAGYVGTHAADFLATSDPWFRGVELVYGQRGEVYLADWSDVGECHENDGVHRTTGRIYRIDYGRPQPAPFVDLQKLSSEKLIALLEYESDWFARHAQRILQERAAAGAEIHSVHAALLAKFNSTSDIVHKLRAMWALGASGGMSESWLREQLGHENEHVRVWAVRLLADQPSVSDETLAALERSAATDDSGLVLLYTASALQRLAHEHRWPIATALSGRDEFRDDPVLPLMVWYGIEKSAPLDAERAVALLEACRLPVVRKYIARRLTLEIENNPRGADLLVAALGRSGSGDGAALDILAGMNEALRGWRKAKPPSGWSEAGAALSRSSNGQIRSAARSLSAVFGDGRALRELREIAADRSADAALRRQAVQSLVRSRAENLGPLLLKLLGDRDVAAEAVRGMAALDEGDAGRILVGKFGGLAESAQWAAVDALTSRQASAAELLAAVRRGAIERRHVSAFHLRQMQLFDNADLDEQIKQLWPQLRLLSGDKVEKIAAYRKRLTPQRIAGADAVAGRVLYQKNCGKCHRLYGEGGAIGPELTGAQRNNLNYLLENIVDPSATLAKDYRMSILQLADGRVVNGVVVGQNQQTLTVQTPTEQVVIAKDDVEQTRQSELSLMPEGQLDLLTLQETAHLFAFLMSTRPVSGGDATGGAAP